IAWCSLGQLYEYALKDIENAVECYKKAVAADVVSAYYYLGHCYKYGTGIPKDYAKAVELFEIVITKVNRGEVTFLQSWYGATYYEIGHCYYNGFGVEENIEKAIGFFQEAEVYGNDTAKYVLEFILESAYFDEYNRRPIYKKIPYLENDFTEALNFGEISENTINKSAKRRTFDYHRAIGIIQEAAQRGVPESQIRYGKCLENGFGVEQNYELAEEWYTKAANQGSVTAYICLADLYMNEDYHNLSVAIEWYTKAAEQGAVRAQNSLGFLYSGYGVSDYQKAVYWYTKAAEQGDADAQYNLGEFYEMGRGVVQNYTTAIEWFIKASSEIDIAKVTIGNIYYQEFRNYSKAIEWFSQIDYSIRDFSYFNHNVSFNPLDLADCYVNVGAYDEAIKIYKFFAIQPLQHNFNRTGRFIPRSNNGIIVTSLYNLVCLYGEGKVDEQDYQKALDLFTHAVENGSAEAQFKLGCLYENGKGVEQDYQKALKLFIQSSENGNTDAQVELGRLYENGLGVEQNHQKSLKLYTQAAENGNTEAKFKLALYYGYKHNNYQLAINWIIKALGPRWSWNINNSCKAAYLNETIDLLTKAAEQGNVIAQFNLGVCYDIGYGVKQDSPKAVELYTRAAEKGNVDAQSRLGSCYENGEGVAKDYAKAVEWYTKAAKQGSEWAQNKIKKLNNVNNDKNANE
ncbi:MAG: sel1 repeat family protein, partial [Bacteroidales bacterium]|nr:sel1 repeat family protein [Bacteroidales bacterium]